ncbi:GNAT family N-acetyltransferase [Methylocapsa palsarum]|uniref:GNAT family N-acetyltransferase n=1 Tax=Methylocapsa palsarum TaxID=1612308 RepID=UPI001114124B
MRYRHRRRRLAPAPGGRTRRAPECRSSNRARTPFDPCYLSDLAVEAIYQRQGIGKRLVDEMRMRAGECATFILEAAPAVESYY